MSGIHATIRQISASVEAPAIQSQNIAHATQKTIQARLTIAFDYIPANQRQKGCPQ